MYVQRTGTICFGLRSGQTTFGLLVPYNALEVGQRHFYTSFMYLGSVVAALPYCPVWTLGRQRFALSCHPGWRQVGEAGRRGLCLGAAGEDADPFGLAQGRLPAAGTAALRRSYFTDFPRPLFSAEVRCGSETGLSGLKLALR